MEIVKKLMPVGGGTPLAPTHELKLYPASGQNVTREYALKLGPDHFGDGTECLNTYEATTTYFDSSAIKIARVWPSCLYPKPGIQSITGRVKTEFNAFPVDDTYSIGVYSLNKDIWIVINGVEVVRNTGTGSWVYANVSFEPFVNTLIEIYYEYDTLSGYSWSWGLSGTYGDYSEDLSVCFYAPGHPYTVNGQLFTASQFAIQCHNMSGTSSNKQTYIIRKG